MAGHVVDGAVQAVDGFDVADCAEKTRDYIESGVQVKIDHVALMELASCVSLACDREEIFIEVEAFALVAVLAKLVDVLAGAAGYIEEAISRGAFLLSDYGSNLRCFGA